MDRGFFFSTDEFALNATYTAAGEGVATIPVLFDKPFDSVLLNTGEMDVEGNTPTCLCKSLDVSDVAHGDVILISGSTYHVVGFRRTVVEGTRTRLCWYWNKSR